MSDSRAAFETFISLPPHEKEILRFPDDGSSAWPGSYKNLIVDLAWDAWQASRQALEGEQLEVWLGSGDKLVADIYADDGSWAGVGIFNPPNGKTQGIGEKDDQIDGMSLDKNKALILIKSTRPESLQVVVEELQEAMAKMGYTHPASAATGARPMSNLYAERDIIEQGKHYSQHTSAMTSEGLHSKSDIAAELAHRDIEIERLQARAAELYDLIKYSQVESGVCMCGDKMQDHNQASGHSPVDVWDHAVEQINKEGSSEAFILRKQAEAVEAIADEFKECGGAAKKLARIFLKLRAKDLRDKAMLQAYEDLRRYGT